jgi:hypothetical protein
MLSLVGLRACNYGTPTAIFQTLRRLAEQYALLGDLDPKRNTNVIRSN